MPPQLCQRDSNACAQPDLAWPCTGTGSLQQHHAAPQSSTDPRDISSANCQQVHFSFILPQPEWAIAKATSPPARDIPHHPSALLGQELNSPHTQLLILSSTCQLTTNINIFQLKQTNKQKEANHQPTSASVGDPRNIPGHKTFFHTNNGCI